MYKIQNDYIIYTEHHGENVWDSHKYVLDIIKSEKELISYLAHGYRYYNYFYGEEENLNKKKNRDNYSNRRFYYFYIDSYGRIINPRIYADDAWEYFLDFVLDREKNRLYMRNKVYHTPKRGEPIPYTGINKYSTTLRPRKLKHVVSMYKNPEFKDFNRGSCSDYPLGYWDDFDRHVEKNWKRQSKRRHQWKEK